MRMLTINVAALDADGIGASQTPAAGGVQALVLDGALTTTNPNTGISEWIADVPRVIGIDSAGNDSGLTFTITGTLSNGSPSTEALTGANIGVATSAKVWRTITGITTSGDTAAAITIGTTGAVDTQWIPTNLHVSPFNIGFGVSLSTATVVYTVQHTFDDVQDSTITPTAFNHEVVASLSANEDGNYAFNMRAFRLSMTAFTAGTLKFHSSQAGINGGT